MQIPEHYQQDLLFFFDKKPAELELYETLVHRMEEMLPKISVKVQKSQISFYAGFLFAAVSLPVRRKKEWPEHCIILTLGLPYRLDSPRVAVAVEPYPNRWTHHIPISEKTQIDEELSGWIRLAYEFSKSKGRR